MNTLSLPKDHDFDYANLKDILTTIPPRIAPRPTDQRSGELKGTALEHFCGPDIPTTPHPLPPLPPLLDLKQAYHPLGWVA